MLLACRYQLLSKQAHQHAGSAKLERESWDVMWSARDLKTNKDVAIKVGKQHSQ